MRSRKVTLYRQIYRVQSVHTPKDQVSTEKLPSLTTCDIWNIAILLSYRYTPDSVLLLFRIQIT